MFQFTRTIQYFLQSNNKYQVVVNKYVFLKKYIKYINEEVYIQKHEFDKPSWFNTLAALIIDYFKSAELNNDKIKKLGQIALWRNNYIHNKKSHLSPKEVKSIVEMIKFITAVMKG